MSSQYIGPLSPKETEEGMKAAIDNAASLIEDAEILFQNDRFPRAFSLSVLAVEEIGKIAILRDIVVREDQEGLRKVWKEYISHQSKNKLFQADSFAELAKPEKWQDFIELFEPGNNIHTTTELLKQKGFYTDCLSNKEWSIPTLVISKEMALNSIQIAKKLLTASTAMTSEQELTIWVKHMKPVWGVSEQAMEQGLKACYEEIHSLRNTQSTELK